MAPARSTLRVLAATPFPASAALLQRTTTAPGTGAEGLVDFWPILTRIGWFLGGFLAVVVFARVLLHPVLARVLRRRNRNNPTIQEAILLYFRLFVVFVAVLVGAGVAGYGAFLANSALVISAVALAIGVAAQELIGSLVSGVALVLDREFNVGDYIEWSGGEGIVQGIALRVTRVETPDGELVTIPNTVLTNEAITRPFGRGNYRVVQELLVDFEEDVDETTAHLERAAASVEDILADPSPSVYIDELGESAVVFHVHYWIRDPDRRSVFAIRSAYARAVKARLEGADVTISPASQHELRGRLGIDDRRGPGRENGERDGD